MKSIVYKKPRFKSLDKNGMTYVDMHFHSNYSDSFSKVENIMKKARKLGIGVAVTDHNQVRGSVKAWQLRKNVFVVPGIEVSSKQGVHILVYFFGVADMVEFYEKYIRHKKRDNPYLSTYVDCDKIIEYAKQYNAVTSIAHPFAPGYLGIAKPLKRGVITKQLIKDVDAFEVICGQSLKRFNIKAAEYAIEMDKGFTAGSDGHSMFLLGRALTFAHADNLDSFLDAIRKKQNFIIGNNIEVLRLLIPYASTANRHLRYFAPTMKHQYETKVKRTFDYFMPRFKSKVNKITGFRKI